MAKCPNCEAIVSWDASICGKCKADFGPESAWRPIPETSEEQKRLKATASTQMSTGSEGAGLYMLALVAMLLGVTATFLAAPLAAIFPLERGATFAQALQVMLSIKIVVNPVPLLLRAHVPQLLVTVLFLVQLALIARRVVLCTRNRELVVPVALAGGWKVLLAIALMSWVLGTLVTLSPIFLHALGASGAVWAMQIANTFFTAYIFVPAANLFGVTFFLVEILSAGREGWLPRKGGIGSTTSRTAGAHGDEGRRVLFRRVAAVGLTAGLALVIVPPVWSLYPTGLVHEVLCRERSGEHVYEKTRAKSYVLIGEGGSDDGFHLHHALEDVTSRRVEFIEVVMDPRNIHQRHSFISLLGKSKPADVAFRVSLGSADSPDCARRVTPMYGTRLELEQNQCLRFTPIASPSSRYRVEAVNAEPANWYTPHIHAYGARVVDAEQKTTLGEHMRFTRTGLLAFFFVAENRRGCPALYGFKPTQMHRKVLFGEH